MIWVNLTETKAVTQGTNKTQKTVSIHFGTYTDETNKMLRHRVIVKTMKQKYDEK